jgi:anti-sigma regulatory factor (Ser/Thr protein kinase)
MMPKPADPWRSQRKPGPSGVAGGLATTTTAEHPGDHIELPVLPVAAGWARRRGGEILREWEVDADTVETVSLLISELVTNALLHGVPEAFLAETPARCTRCGAQVCVNLKEEPGAVVVEVFDSGTTPPHSTPVALETDLSVDGECGRGLMIVANLSEEQGYYLTPDGGKIVWCVVKAGS